MGGENVASWTQKYAVLLLYQYIYLKSVTRRKDQPLRKIPPSKYEASVFWETFLEEPYIQYSFLSRLFPAKLMIISYCTLLNELGYDRVDLPNGTRKG